jgi:hypothetical protein
MSKLACSKEILSSRTIFNGLLILLEDIDYFCITGLYLFFEGDFTTYTFNLSYEWILTLLFYGTTLKLINEEIKLSLG